MEPRTLAFAPLPVEFTEALGRDIAAIQNPRPVFLVGAVGITDDVSDLEIDEKNRGSAAKQRSYPQNNHSAKRLESSEFGMRVGFATVIWVTPLSHKPPLVAFALRETSYTMELIKVAGAFSLATLPRDEQSASLVELCGNQSGHQVRKELLVPYCFIESAGVIAPVPNHCLSWELGRVERVEPAGDHNLVIGTIVKAASRATRDGDGRLSPVETLLCVQRGVYGAIPLSEEGLDKPGTILASPHGSKLAKDLRPVDGDTE